MLDPVPETAFVSSDPGLKVLGYLAGTWSR
jgi:hypothetical protein